MDLMSDDIDGSDHSSVAKTVSQMLDDFSDDSIDPQIEYDLIIDEKTTFGSIFATDGQIIEEPIDEHNKETEEDVIDGKDINRESEELVPIETSNEVTVESIETIDNNNDPKSVTQDQQMADPMVTSCVENAMNCVSEESTTKSNTKKKSLKDSKFKPPIKRKDKKSSDKKSTEMVSKTVSKMKSMIGSVKQMKTKKSQSNDEKTDENNDKKLSIDKKSEKIIDKKSSNIEMSAKKEKNKSKMKQIIGSLKETKSQKRPSNDNTKRKSNTKRAKTYDRKYQIKRKSVEMSKEKLEQLFGKVDEESTQQNPNEDKTTEYESLYTEQCKGWFRRETRHKSYDFNEKSSQQLSQQFTDEIQSQEEVQQKVVTEEVVAEEVIAEEVVAEEVVTENV